MGDNYYHRRHLYSDDEIVACYLKHESQNKAAAELGIGRETVARAVRRKGLKLTGRNRNGRNQPQEKISDAQLIEEAKELNCREIAVKYGMSEERVWRRAKKLGLDISSRGAGGKWRKRADRYGCVKFDRTISLKSLIERDGGVCQICGESIDKEDITNG